MQLEHIWYLSLRETRLYLPGEKAHVCTIGQGAFCDKSAFSNALPGGQG